MVEDFQREHRDSSVEYWTHYNIHNLGWHHSSCSRSLIKTKKNQRTNTHPKKKSRNLKQLKEVKKLMRLESGITDATRRFHFVFVLREFHTKQKKHDLKQTY